MDRRGFGGLVTDGQWEHLLASSVPRTFARGQTLLRQGEVGGGIHLMVSGRAKVVSFRADGSCVPLAFRTCGEMLGESSLAGERPRSATVTALSPSSTAFLPAERFQRLLAELGLEPVLWRSALMRQDEGDRIRVRQTSLPAERRLPAALLHLASVMGEPMPEPVSDAAPATRGCLLRIPLAQREIAEFAGMSRTSVHNAYTSLRERGVIRTGRQYVAILDLAALETLAGEDETV